MHTPSHQAKLLILMKCRKINPYLNRTESKLVCRGKNNLNRTEYKIKFDLDSKPTTLTKPDNPYPIYTKNRCAKINFKFY